MRLLLDSSGPWLLAALALRGPAGSSGSAADEGWTVLAEVREPGRPPEGRDIGTVVQGLLEQARAASGQNSPPADSGAAAVSSVIVGLGPGSFIGTRVAISYANGFAAAAAGAELIGVPSLAAISLAHGGLPVLRDARRGQWYLHRPQAPLEQRDQALGLPALLMLLQQEGHGELLLEEPASIAARPARRPGPLRNDPFAELQEAAATAGLKLTRVPGPSALGLLRAAEQASASDYVEPVYLRSFL
ncbi:hypothetical protein IT575_02935 [bacterium]|nr:hypothetical protein [bacterium]